MEVLYNSNYGGFHISLFAVLKLIKKKKRYIDVYRTDPDNPDWYKRIQTSDTGDIDYWGDLIFVQCEGTPEMVHKSYFDDITHGISVMSQDDVYELFSNPENLRFDKKLIKLFKKYGSEKISAKGSKLELEVVPQGTSFSINKYDGSESINQYCSDNPIYYAYK